MSKYRLYELKGDWDIENNGTLISSHKTRELAHARMVKEAKKKVKTIYYWREILMDEKTSIFDYGLYTRFFAIREEEVVNDNP